MKRAEDFRRIAREALTGKWLIAIATGLVASILGAGNGNMPQITIHTDAPSAGVNLNGQQILSSSEGLNSNLGALILGGFSYIMIVAFIIGLVLFVLGSFVSVGYAKFNLNLVDRKEVTINTLFDYFSYWKTTAVARFLRNLYVFLWSLLFIIPGIIASLSYAMTDYILAENPEMTASEAIKQSKTMMNGNCWRLFCLEFSFFGWNLLAVLTCGVGYLWLTPYMSAAYAAFYREISQTENEVEL